MYYSVLNYLFPLQDRFLTPENQFIQKTIP